MIGVDLLKEVDEQPLGICEISRSGLEQSGAASGDLIVRCQAVCLPQPVQRGGLVAALKVCRSQVRACDVVPPHEALGVLQLAQGVVELPLVEQAGASLRRSHCLGVAVAQGPQSEESGQTWFQARPLLAARKSSAIATRGQGQRVQAVPQVLHAD